MKQENLKQISALYQKAMSEQSTGNLKSALNIYGRILNMNPRIAEAHFQVGKIFYLVNKFKNSAHHLSVAATLKPNEADIWNELAKSLLCLGDAKLIKKALSDLKKTNIPAPTKIIFQNMLMNKNDGNRPPMGGVNASDLNAISGMIKSGQAALARPKINSLIKQFPSSPSLFEINGQALLREGNPAKAMEAFQHALKLDPTFAYASIMLAETNLQIENKSQAAKHLRDAIVAAPRSVLAVFKLADLFTSENQLDDAELLLENAIKENPKEPLFYEQIANIFARKKQHDTALEYMEKAIKNGLNTAEGYVSYGLALYTVERVEDAMEAYAKAESINPNYAPIYYRKASIHQHSGEFDKAIENNLIAIKLAPQNASFYLAYVASQKLSADDPILATMVELLENPKLPKVDKAGLSFAIAKAHEDNKKYDEAIPYLKLANDTSKELYPYRYEMSLQEFNEIKHVYADITPENIKNIGYDAANPIFICGMPRSGTTLVEQIISSHSLVSGAGEVGYCQPACVAAFLGEDKKKLRKMIDMPPEEIRALGQDMSEYLAAIDPTAARITDKSIQTYKHIAMMKAAMPNCKIIILRRDPRDNLLSIYKNKFAENTHSYSYDMEMLGKYYNLFIDYMDYWREKFPDLFYEVHYEDIIDNPEEEARKLIKYCDLEWEDACLNFHESKRKVKTLSTYQVRQPIYKSSVKAWQRYEEHLQPLFNVLKEGGNYPTDD